jgi:hypothetical protein
MTNNMFETMCYEATKRVQNNQEKELDKCHELFKELLNKKDPLNIFTVK